MEIITSAFDLVDKISSFICSVVSYINNSFTSFNNEEIVALTFLPSSSLFLGTAGSLKSRDVHISS